MKFENIKIGDTIFIKEDVQYNWGESKQFYIPKKVISTTATQFKTEGDIRFNKKGNQIGEAFKNAYYKGDNDGWGSKQCFVHDQTEERDIFKKKVQTEHAIDKLLRSLRCPINSNMSQSKLDEILTKLHEIDATIKQSKK